MALSPLAIVFCVGVCVMLECNPAHTTYTLVHPKQVRNGYVSGLLFQVKRDGAHLLHSLKFLSNCSVRVRQYHEKKKYNIKKNQL